MDFKQRGRIIEALRPLRPWPMHPSVDAVRRRHRSVDYLLMKPDVEVGEVVRLEVKSWEEPARILSLEKVEPQGVTPHEAQAQGYASLLEVFSGIATQSLWETTAKEDVWCVRWEVLSGAEFDAWWPPRRMVTVPARSGTVQLALYAEVDRLNGGWFGHVQALPGTDDRYWTRRRLVWDEPEPHYLACLDRVEEAVEAIAYQEFRHAAVHLSHASAGMPLYAPTLSPADLM